MFAFPARVYNSTERGAAWSACPPAGLAEYAGQWHDMTTGASTEEFDWVYLADFPVSLLWSLEDAKEWWADQNEKAQKYGMEGMWDNLLEKPVLDPIVVSLYGRDLQDRDCISNWDENHRTAACAVAVSVVPYLDVREHQVG